MITILVLIRLNKYDADAAVKSVRSATTTSSTVQSAGFTGSWAEVVTGVRWQKNSCRSTARAERRTAPSWSGRARRLLEITLCHSGQCR